MDMGDRSAPDSGNSIETPKMSKKAKKLGSCIYGTRCEFYLAVGWAWRGGAVARCSDHVTTTRPPAVAPPQFTGIKMKQKKIPFVNY